MSEQLAAVAVVGSHRSCAALTVADALRTAALEAAGWTVVVIRSRTFATDLVRAIATIRSASVVSA